MADPKDNAARTGTGQPGTPATPIPVPQPPAHEEAKPETVADSRNDDEGDVDPAEPAEDGEPE